MDSGRKGRHPRLVFGLGFTEIAVILVVALLIFGPAKLPELARALGRGLREFRKATDEFRSTIDSELHAPDPPRPEPPRPAPLPPVTETVARERPFGPVTEAQARAPDAESGEESDQEERLAAAKSVLFGSEASDSDAGVDPSGAATPSAPDHDRGAEPDGSAASASTDASSSAPSSSDDRR